MDMKTAQENRKLVIKELDKLVKMSYTGLPCRDHNILIAARDCIQILYNDEETRRAYKEV